ncbi:MAG: hypothetical protein IKK71_02555, partial [Clostridia bacterium]|nr:hypothetical protein [Clostridia bacterium]
MDTQNNIEQVNTPQPTNIFTLAKSDTAFAIFALAASIFTAIFGILGGFALGYLISLTLMLIIFTIYFAKSGKLSFFSVISGLLALGNGAVFITTSNASVRFFAFVISFLLTLTYLGSLALGNKKGNRQTVGIFYSAISTMG